jgi:hypothetical protein
VLYHLSHPASPTQLVFDKGTKEKTRGLMGSKVRRWNVNVWSLTWNENKVLHSLKFIKRKEHAENVFINPRSGKSDVEVVNSHRSMDFPFQPHLRLASLNRII